MRVVPVLSVKIFTLKAHCSGRWEPRGEGAAEESRGGSGRGEAEDWSEAVSGSWPKWERLGDAPGSRVQCPWTWLGGVWSGASVTWASWVCTAAGPPGISLIFQHWGSPLPRLLSLGSLGSCQPTTPINWKSPPNHCSRTSGYKRQIINA